MIESVSILIPTHNRAELLCQTIESLIAIALPPGVSVELLVVANACTDDTVARATPLLGRLPFPARLVEEPEPGLNPARNRAVRDSRGEVCAFLDDDVLVDVNWLVELIGASDARGADIVGARVLLWWKDVRMPAWAGPFTRSMLSEVDHGTGTFESPSMVGANFSFRRTVYEQVGGFRKGLDRTPTSLMGGGETDLVRRAIAQGFKSVHCGSALVQHYVSPNRLEGDYLARVAQGFGHALVFRKPSFGVKPSTRSILGYTYIFAKGMGMRVAGALRREPGLAHDGFLYQHLARGGLNASLRRLRGASPVAVNGG